MLTRARTGDALLVSGPLVIVPCGRAKVWDRNPQAGPTAAREAYTGRPFRVNVAYAERFAARWVILSAKHGLVDPDFVIDEPYDVTFNRKSSHPIDAAGVREQIAPLGLDRFDVVVGLGGRRYREIISEAFRSHAVRLCFPFAGLALGKMVRATRLAIERSDPYLPHQS